ncbi:hypothetical protein OG576_06695 [Streptomyces sp. NBC_01500]|nr:hypothetical protein [Streptomyces sp. NBC_01500]MCX4548551.1 hypothetical protein [Streptomyces sp. NBC_01500]
MSQSFRIARDATRRPVNSVDDPTTATAPTGAELLTDERVAGMFGVDRRAQGTFDLTVRLGDRTSVALFLGAQTGCPEVASGALVRLISQAVRQRQVC